MNIDLEQLKRLAEKATSGPWAIHDNACSWTIGGIPKEGDTYGKSIALVQTKTERAASNAAYIHAASPDVILALIADRAAILANRNELFREKEALAATLAEAIKQRDAALALLNRDAKK